MPPHETECNLLIFNVKKSVAHKYQNVSTKIVKFSDIGVRLFFDLVELDSIPLFPRSTVARPIQRFFEGSGGLLKRLVEGAALDRPGFAPGGGTDWPRTWARVQHA